MGVSLLLMVGLTVYASEVTHGGPLVYANEMTQDGDWSH